VTLLAQEGVLAVELVPGEVHAVVHQRVVDHAAALGRHVRVLPAPEHAQLALDLAGAHKRFVAGGADPL